MAQKTKGLTIVFTGNGKGKTTAALGMAMRAVGHGKRVLFLQFVKKFPYGEARSSSRFGKNLVLKQMGGGFLCQKTRRGIKKHKAAAEKALKFAKSAIASGKYHIIVLDEINCAIHFGLIPVKLVIEMIQSKPKSLHLVLTGRWAKKSVIKHANLVSEMKDVKHPYRKGVKAQKGIEF